MFRHFHICIYYDPIAPLNCLTGLRIQLYSTATMDMEFTILPVGGGGSSGRRNHVPRCLVDLAHPFERVSCCLPYICRYFHQLTGSTHAGHIGSHHRMFRLNSYTTPVHTVRRPDPH